MDKDSRSLKLKAFGTLTTSLILITLAVSIFDFELSYIHTRDSSRADSTSSTNSFL